jgi:hypothetical protein
MGNTTSIDNTTYCKWKHIFSYIYIVQFQQENYLPYRLKKLEEAIHKLNWTVNVNSILERLKICHNNGYTGFHFIDGKYPTETVDNYIRNLFDKTDYVASRYCKTHNKMCLYINIHALNIPEKELKFSYNEGIDKMVDFCYEFKD